MTESKKVGDDAAPKKPKVAKEEEAAPKAEAPVTAEAALAEPKKKAAPKAKKEETPAPAPAPAENLSLSPDSVEQPKIVKAKGSKNVHNGIAHILATFNKIGRAHV